MATITAEVTGEHVLKTRCRWPRIARPSPIVVPAASAGSRWLLARHSWLRQGVVPGRILDPTTSAELRRPAAQTVSTQGAVRLVAIAADARIVEGEGGQGPRRHRMSPLAWWGLR